MSLLRIGLARGILLALLVVKVAISAWNAHAYHGVQYDRAHHLRRIASGGLDVRRDAYNPPLYYLPSLAFNHLHRALAPDVKVRTAMELRDLRYANTLYLAAFYGLWVCMLFPMLLPNEATSFVASLLLLAVPGFQKLAMMAHPDNLVPLCTAIALVLWLRGRRRSGMEQAPQARSWAARLGLAMCIGVIGLTRPFAAATVGVMWAAAVADEMGRPTLRALLGARFLGRALAITLIVGTISLSWYVYRYVETGESGGTYNQRYIGMYERHRAGFDFVHFFTSFYPLELLQRPNRSINGFDTQNPRFENRYGNSFWTVLHSEIWGDHWLHVSGHRTEERKLWPKRVMIALALPLMLLVPLGWLRSAIAAVRIGPRRVIAAREPLVIALAFILGAGLYLYWATGSGLLPGKSSSIKFIYIAHLVPLGLVLALLAPLRPGFLRALRAYAFVLYFAALPVAIFVPSQAGAAPRAAGPRLASSTAVQLVDSDLSGR